MINKAYPKYGQVMEINFNESYDEPEIPKKLSEFDQNLKKGLDYNPKDED